MSRLGNWPRNCSKRMASLSRAHKSTVRKSRLPSTTTQKDWKSYGGLVGSAQDRRGAVAHSAASANASLGSMKWLIEHGADPTRSIYSTEQPSRRCETEGNWGFYRSKSETTDSWVKVEGRWRGTPISLVVERKTDDESARRDLSKFLFDSMKGRPLPDTFVATGAGSLLHVYRPTTKDIDEISTTVMFLVDQFDADPLALNEQGRTAHEQALHHGLRDVFLARYENFFASATAPTISPTQGHLRDHIYVLCVSLPKFVR